jgi:hypothetical protein
MNDESSWLIQRSKECLSAGNHEAADSWIITATSLYPNSFAVQVIISLIFEAVVVIEKYYWLPLAL